MSTLANQPAFPAQSHVKPNGEVHPFQSGMTLRQYYAGKALQGLLSDPAGNSPYERFASDAVRLADALIAELEKTK